MAHQQTRRAPVGARYSGREMPSFVVCHHSAARSTVQSAAKPHSANSRSMAAADGKRSAGSFARQRATTADKSVGTSGRKWGSSGGGSERCAGEELAEGLALKWRPAGQGKKRQAPRP